MDILPKKTKVSEVFHAADPVPVYTIPDYQRGFSWGNSEIETFFNDIENEEKGYYIGNILVTGLDDDHLSVIDGQQRLTTLALLLLALGEKFLVIVKSNGVRAFDAWTDYTDIRRMLFVESESGSTTTRLTLLDSDQEIFSNLLGALLLDSNQQPVNQPKKWGNRKFGIRYRFIKSLLADKETFESLHAFFSKLKMVEMLQIRVPNVGDAFSVFTSLNSKSLPLTLVDLLKGEFISAAASAGYNDSYALDQWNELSSVLSEKDRDTDTRLVTQFLLNNYDAFESEASSSTTKSKALNQYQKLIHSRYQRGEDYLSILIKRAKTYARICQVEEPDRSDKIYDKELKALHRLDSSQSLPLLMYLIDQEDKLEITELLPEILRALISFFVRRNICQRPKSSNIRARFISMLREIQNPSKDLHGLDVANVVLKGLTASDMCPSDEMLDAALDGPVYLTDKKTTRYVLIDIERAGENRSDFSPLYDGKQFIENFDDSSKWTIEHILPQTEGSLPDYWVSEIACDDPDEARRLQEKYVHTFGNLTLTAYNSELSLKPFYCEYDSEKSCKRDYKDPKTGHYFGLRNPLYLNSSIADSENGEALETKEHWTIDDIKRRNDWFKKQIKDLYRLPMMN